MCNHKISEWQNSGNMRRVSDFGEWDSCHYMDSKDEGQRIHEGEVSYSPVRAGISKVKGHIVEIFSLLHQGLRDSCKFTWKALRTSKTYKMY